MVSDELADHVVAQIAQSSLTGAPLRAQAMNALFGLDGYDWVGVYRLELDTLVLDEYVGAATDHTRIAVGTGVCGTAIAQNANQVVADVRKLTNYLSCSAQTRSEIVVLIGNAQGLLGQIDVDGHRVGAFDASDEMMLDQIAAILAERWKP